MQGRTETFISEAQVEKTEVSVTAIGVAMAFATSVLTEHDYIFNKNIAYLTQHLCTVGMKRLRGKAWLLANSLPYLPYACQQKFFETIKRGYGQHMLLRK
jgi:hypothetical protein